MSLMQGAKFLNVPALFELCCACIASEFKAKEFCKMKKDLFIHPITQEIPPRMQVMEQAAKPGVNLCYSTEQDEELMKKYPWILEDLDKDND